MSKKLKEMCLVEGEVAIRIRISSLVTLQESQDESYIEELFSKKAFENLGSADDLDVEYDNEVPVLLTEEIADLHLHKDLYGADWGEIIKESKENTGGVNA